MLAKWCSPPSYVGLIGQTVWKGHRSHLLFHCFSVLSAARRHLPYKINWEIMSMEYIYESVLLTVWDNNVAEILGVHNSHDDHQSWLYLTFIIQGYVQCLHLCIKLNVMLDGAMCHVATWKIAAGDLDECPVAGSYPVSTNHTEPDGRCCSHFVVHHSGFWNLTH